MRRMPSTVVQSRRAAWRSPRELPRWASRLTLEILGVRREPVQAISDADLLAEGGMWREGKLPGAPDVERAGFARWWSEVNAKGGAAWERNQEVWVVEFRREPDGDS